MVQNEAINTSIETNGKPEGLPEGRYRLVGWSIDTTGRRLIDEICQIAAYTPSSQFSQYIMPFSDFNPIYRRRHSLRVINLGRYRMLKDLRTNKFVKTKSEVSALSDFLDWLEKSRGDATDGIILIYHELRKSSPGMLLEAFRRYNLMDRFSTIVKGFVNGFKLAEAKCAKSTKTYSLRIMSKVLLNKEEDLGNAKDNARSCYEVAAHLAQGEKAELDAQGSGGDCTGAENHLIELVRTFANSVSTEENEIAGFKVLLERQNTFRPVFGAFLRATFPERKHASYLRRLLAENDIDYEKLKTAYEKEAKEGLEKTLKSGILSAKEKDLIELLEILDCFFDPDKKAVQPKPRFFQNQNRRPRMKRDKENSEKNSNNNNSTDTSGNVSKEITPRSEPEQVVAVAVTVQ